MIKNEKYNRLISIAFSHRTKKNLYWIFLCDCGTYTKGRVDEVIKGVKKSCGCLQKEYWKTKKNTIKPKGIAARNALINTYKSNAKKRNLTYALTNEQFNSLAQTNCYYCGIEPLQKVSNKFSKRNGDYIYNGIDRLDNKQGYILKNCVPCCGLCNRAKNNLTLEQFNEWINRLINYRRLIVNQSNVKGA